MSNVRIERRYQTQIDEYFYDVWVINPGDGPQCGAMSVSQWGEVSVYGLEGMEILHVEGLVVNVEALIGALIHWELDLGRSYEVDHAMVTSLQAEGYLKQDGSGNFA